MNSSTTVKSIPSVVRTASIEFQLVNSLHHGIIGRLFIPNSLAGKDALHGATIIPNGDTAITSTTPGNAFADKALSMRACTVITNYNSRTIFFTAPIAEYERLLDLYSNSNLAVNIVRTVRLLRQLHDAAALEVSYTRVIDTPVTAAMAFEPVATVSEIEKQSIIKRVAPVVSSDLASLAQLKGCRASFLKAQLRSLNVYGRSKLYTIAMMAEVLNGRVAIADLPK